MSAQEVINNLVAFTEARNEFNDKSHATVPSNLNQGLVTLVLVITGT